MSRVYFKLRTGRNYFMHTHSLPVYRRLLDRNGFSREKEYYPWPNYRTPTEFMELKRGEIIDFLGREIKNSKRFGRKWSYLVLLKILTALEGRGFFCHSFLFVYRKPE